MQYTCIANIPRLCMHGPCTYDRDKTKVDKVTEDRIKIACIHCGWNGLGCMHDITTELM